MILQGKAVCRHLVFPPLAGQLPAVDALQEYLRDYYGTAMMGGLWPAVADWGAGDLDGRELCERAESMGIDLQRFVVGE